MFEVLWKVGDHSWLPYHEVDWLDALREYFSALGITGISELGKGESKLTFDDPQVYVGLMGYLEGPGKDST